MVKSVQILSLAVPWMVGFDVLSSSLPGLSSWKAETAVMGFYLHQPFALAGCPKLSGKERTMSFLFILIYFSTSLDWAFGPYKL